MGMPLPQQPSLNRSKNCRLCGKRGVREQRKAPIRKGDAPEDHPATTHEDPDYVVAVCPTCDSPPPPEPEKPANAK